MHFNKMSQKTHNYPEVKIILHWAILIPQDIGELTKSCWFYKFLADLPVQLEIKLCKHKLKHLVNYFSVFSRLKN